MKKENRYTRQQELVVGSGPCPELTIGMAHFEDLDSIVMMIQAIRLNHQPLQNVELVVIDNSPATDSGKELRKFLASVQAGQRGPFGFRGVKYVPFTECTGTTATRERIFAEATGRAVLVMDCHVIPFAGAIQWLLEFYRANPACDDLLAGPIFYDGLDSWDTQFNDLFRSEMWGVWGGAWRCGCGRSGKVFTTIAREPGRVHLVEMLDQLKPAGTCPNCQREFPETMPDHAWQQQLLESNCQPLGGNPEEPPFEIPAMGLGLFACRREAWLGFNPHFREFGGEEWFIHEKFRQAGRKVLLMPWLAWWHKFQRVGGPKYRYTKLGKVRNLVVGHEEIGRPLDRIRDHFYSLEIPEEQHDLATHLAFEHGVSQEEITGKSPEELAAIHQRCKVTKEQWEQLMTDPIQHVTSEMQKAPTTFTVLQPQPHGDMQDLASLYEWVTLAGRDDPGHLAMLRGLAGNCQAIVEVTKRRETTVALATGLAESPGEGERLMITIQSEMDALVPRTLVAAMRADERVIVHGEFGKNPAQVTIPPVDLLFIDHIHEAAVLLATLNQLGDQVQKWIVLRGTEAFGNFAEGSTKEDPRPGLYPGWSAWISGNPERAKWKRVGHEAEFYGLTVFSCIPTDRSIDWGPGSVLTDIMQSIQFTAPPGCDCKKIARDMDEWGPEGCEERFGEIVQRMKEGQEKWGWATHFAAIRSATIAVTTGLAAQVNWLDPIPGLVRLAIDRAREEERKKFGPGLKAEGLSLKAEGEAVQAAAQAAQEPIRIYFDIDGVLNTTPARGDLGFGVDPEKCDLLAALPGEKVCISFWRNASADQIQLPFPFTLAPKGEKRNSHPGATLIIDDQPSLYDADAPVFAINGAVGLTAQDAERIGQWLAVVTEKGGDHGEG